MKISVFGLGYVGAVSCACLAKLGHQVIGVDVAQAKVDLINRGESPLSEEGLAPLLADAVAKGLLRATRDAADAVAATEIAMLCVGTPSTPSGGVDAGHLEAVCDQIGEVLRNGGPDFFCVMTRSTSLPPVHRALIERLAKVSGRAIGEGIGYVCHPEFLREGSSVRDFFEPPKIVFGTTDPRSESLCGALYPGVEGETVFVSVDTAAMVKYADNCFHAVKVTFANEIGTICGQMGIDAQGVMDVFCRDHKLNLSPRYLRPGGAFGGSCLPKDLRAMLDFSRSSAVATPLLHGVQESNRKQVEALLSRVAGPDRPRVGVVGLAFKEGTDDVRESPMVALVEQLCGKGHPVRVYDGHLRAAELIGSNRRFALASIPHLEELLTDRLQEVIDHAQVLVVSHRLTPQLWEGVRFQPGSRVIDLVRVDELRGLPGYEGVYW